MNRQHRLSLFLLPPLLAVYVPMCTPRVQPTGAPWQAHMAQLWQKPEDLADRDLFYGPWGAENAPDPHAIYTLVDKKRHGTNPGVVVTDDAGREWHVKQPPHNDHGAEGPVEVAISRVLSGVGYHQPPVYFLPSFTMRDETGTHTAPGGRFRLKVKGMANVGTWSWQQNEFVGSMPYQGLLAALMMFNSSDLKNDNNTLYEFKHPRDGVERWYVVRDLGCSLGDTGKIYPKRGDIDQFARRPFIRGVSNGFVEFEFHGLHQELIQHRITPAEIEWASDLLGGLSRAQWMDAFRAGGYEPALAGRFVQQILERIEQGHRIGLAASRAGLLKLWWPPVGIEACCA
jgi:hypothetical protein